MKQLLLIAGACLFSALTQAQNKDFAGNWILSQRTPVSGPDYVNGVPTDITISFKGDSISLERKGTDDHNQEVSSKETLMPDGRPHSRITATNRKKTATVTWTASQQSFSETSNLSVPGNSSEGDYQTSETFSLSADNKTLILERHFQSLKNPDDQWTMKGEYERQ